VSVKYRLVQWTPVKIAYDGIAVAGIAGFIALFTKLGGGVYEGAEALSSQVVAMRAWGACALTLLTVILTIGPAARLEPRFAPLLYNRRHLGVLLFFVAANHARLVLDYYHAFSDVPKLESLLTFDAAFTGASLPFQLFGAAALLIFFLMAATSHDFWQKTLGPAWKSLHMLVYPAYLLVMMHVAFGALQWETSPFFPAALIGSALGVCGLHLAASRASNALPEATATDGWLDAGEAATLADGRARAVCPPGGERIAVIRSGETISAIHGVCAHQGGPLYEGRVLDGCLTCPWHGWQYHPETGASPPPFEEQVPVHEVRLVGGRILVNPDPREEASDA